MILFKLRQSYRGHQDVVSTHTSLADAVASVKLPTEWIEDGAKLRIPQRVGADRWVMGADVPCYGGDRKIEYVATIARLATRFAR